MPGAYEYRLLVWQDNYNCRRSNRQSTSYLERTAAVSSFLAVHPHVPGPLSSPLLSPVCEYSCVCIGHEAHESRMNHAACNVESGPLDCWNSVSTAQLVELTSDVLEINLRKNEYSTPCHPACKHARGLLRHSRGRGARRGSFGLRGDPHRKLARQKPKNTSKKS